MQPSVTQSAATAHIDDLVRAAQAYRLASDDRPRRGQAVATIKRALICAASGSSPRAHKPQHA